MESLSREQLLRLAADEELSAEQSHALERDSVDCADGEVFIANERALRCAVKRVMEAEVVVPNGLRGRIMAGWKRFDSGHQESLPMRRRRWFVPSGLAAGILILVGASVMISVWSNKIIDQSENGNLTPSAKAAIDMYNRTRVGPDLIEEAAAGSAWLARTDDAAEAVLAERFGAEHGFVPDIRSFGYHFMGLRTGQQIANSACLVYAHLDSVTGGTEGSAGTNDGDHLAVLWMAKPSEIDADLLKQLEEGRGYRLTSGVIPAGASSPLNGCFAWRTQDIVMIFRINHDQKDMGEAVVQDMARVLGMPSGPVTTIP